MLLAIAFAVALTACSPSATQSASSPVSNSPTSVVTTATSTVPTATATASTTPVHTPDWITVKYRSDQVDVAHPRFAQLDGGSSSLVDATFYDSENGYMIVSLNGTAYHYCGLPGSVWVSFRTASSLGSFFNTAIKGRYDCRTGSVPAY
jgi:hypothetical protein